MNEPRDRQALRRVFLEDTDPDPGLAERMLAGYRRAPTRRRSRWALGAVAVALAVAVVTTLLLVRAQAVRRVVPASTPPPAPTSPPPAVAAHQVTAAAFTDPRTGWIVETDDGRPYRGRPAVLLATTDGGAHWTRQLDLPSGPTQIRAEPGGSVLLEVDGVTQAASTHAYYGTSDGGAHWQQLSPPPLTATGGEPMSMVDAHEAWFGVWQSTRLWTVYHTTDGARTWQRQVTIDLVQTFGDGGLGPVAFLDAQHALYAHAAATGPFEVSVTADGGAHWRQVAVPEPPGVALTAATASGVVTPLPGGQAVLTVVVHGPAPSIDPAGWRPPSPPAVSGAYTYVTRDQGQHWSEARPLPDPDPLATVVFPGDAGHWWSFTPDGGVNLSADQGASWSRAGDLPHGMAPESLAFAGPQLGWATAANLPGNVPNVVLLTADGGRTWTPLPPPDPIEPRVPCGGGPVEVTGRVHVTVAAPGVLVVGPPAGLGQTAGCRYRLWAEDGEGSIAIGSTPAERGRVYTLGDLLDVWGVADPQHTTQFADPGRPAAVDVDGRPATGDLRAIPLRNGSTIVIRPSG